jgi:hypothetical protein
MKTSVHEKAKESLLAKRLSGRAGGLLLGLGVLLAGVGSPFLALHAQAMDVSVLGSWSSSSFSVGGPVELGSSTGWGFGAAASRSFGLLDVQVGVFNNPVGAETQGIESWTRYLQVPALLQLRLPLVTVGFGGYYGIPLSAGTELEGVTAQEADSDLGLMGTVGVRMPLREDWFVTGELGYQWGLVDVNSQAGGDSLKTRNFLVLLGVGLKFF